MGSEGKSRKPHARARQVFRKAPEPELFPFSAAEMLPKDDLALFVRAALDKLDSAPLRKLYGDSGGFPYDPVDMLGVLLLGYALGVTGSRPLEDRCRFDVRFMHVARGARPDDRSICRFRLLLKPVADDLFKQVLTLCFEAGLAPMRRIAIDGTKMSSPASQLSRWIRQCENLDEGLLEPPPTSDPEARALSGPKGSCLGYNAQASVDTEDGVILAVDIVDAGCDRSQLVPMLERTEAMTGRVPQEVTADSGYDSHLAYNYCNRRGILAHIPPQGRESFFWTVLGPNEIVCPMGEVAKLARTDRKGSNFEDVYLVQNCKTCFLNTSCRTNRFGRTLRSPQGLSPTLRLLAAHRARTPEGRQARIDRQSTVETLFGQLKANLRLSRFKLRGQDGARLEFTLMAIAQNLRTLAKAKRGLFGLFFSFQMSLMPQYRIYSQA